jgi:hypothetical protein
MANRHFILIDATSESQVPFFEKSSIFQSWLRSYNNIDEALRFISQIPLPYSIHVYMARDNILDDGLLSDTNGQIRTLIQTCCDLQTIHHVSVFCPTINTDLEQQIRSIIPEPRLIEKVLSVIDLHSDMCLKGISYFSEEITRCKATEEVNLITNFVRNRDELMEYLEKIIADRKRILDAWVDEHSNKSSEEIS